MSVGLFSFAKACDRCEVSNCTAGTIATPALCDLCLVIAIDTIKVIDIGKIRRVQSVM